MNRIEKHIERGFWTRYGAPENGYYAFADAALFGGYVIRHYAGHGVCFQSRSYDSTSDLETAMREIEPDLRRWRLTQGG